MLQREESSPSRMIRSDSGYSTASSYNTLLSDTAQFSRATGSHAKGM